MEAKELIESLGKRLGIELELDDDGICAFEADDLVITIAHRMESSELVLAGDLGNPPPERLEGLCKTLLAANHLFSGTAGAALAFDDAIQHFSLCRAFPLALLDADALYTEVERFVNSAEGWRKIIVDYREAAQAAAPEEPQGIQFGSGFMQV